MQRVWEPCAAHLCQLTTLFLLLLELVLACAWYGDLLSVVHVQVDPADVVIVEGILVLHVPELREQLNMKVYVDTGEGGWDCECVA